MRINFWVSLLLFIASVAFFCWWQFRRPERAGPERRPRPVAKGPKMAVPRGRVR